MPQPSDIETRVKDGLEYLRLQKQPEADDVAKTLRFMFDVFERLTTVKPNETNASLATANDLRFTASTSQARADKVVRDHMPRMKITAEENKYEYFVRDPNTRVLYLWDEHPSQIPKDPPAADIPFTILVLESFKKLGFRASWGWQGPAYEVKVYDNDTPKFARDYGIVVNWAP